MTGNYNELKFHGFCVYFDRNMDWEACVICCKRICRPTLKCPATSNSNNGLEIYKGFRDLADKFSRIDALPVQLDFKGFGTPDNFHKNQAKGHTNCRFNFAESKLVRAPDSRNKLLLKKERLESHPISNVRKSKRLSKENAAKDICMFCSKVFNTRYDNPCT
jgi:hypothetical protein